MVADWLEQVGHGSRLVRASGSSVRTLLVIILSSCLFQLSTEKIIIIILPLLLLKKL